MNLRRPGRSRQLRRAVDTRGNDPECSRVRTLPLVLIGLLLLLAALALAAWWVARRVPVPPTVAGDAPAGEDLARGVIGEAELTELLG